jgi:transposase
MELFKRIIKQLMCRHDYEHVTNQFDVYRWCTHELWRCPHCHKEQNRDHKAS